MTAIPEPVAAFLFIGIGATIVLDLWSVVLTRGFGVPTANWALVGRWLAHIPRGRFLHEPIAATPAVRGERLLGWTFHYAVGIAFAALLLTTQGADWLRHPTLLPALCVGLLTVVFPFFVMQPGMGAGIAASRTPNPTQSRLRSLTAHAVFGVGLYLSAWLWVLVMAPVGQGQS
ncbi:Protein of unknown function (DUF2938) [Luteimonas cucumeris]|uniref:DUF2938 family protein n=1 Tax=Luteimonas cucumeris TaxID=985012 RepID=A0A562KZV7_9GAMM|nr:DUF2938 domain-containing protein [Luteimonas cucumeris]TWI00959.1 Protein of unknown function (DUF2938) [Luteimonas cucumeris]